MSNVPLELIYVVLFISFVVFQYLMKRRAGGPPQEQEAPEAEGVEEWEADAESALPVGEVPFSTWVAPEAPVQLARPESTPAMSPAGARRFSRRALLSTRRDVQEGVVIAAILGPCRALKPWE